MLFRNCAGGVVFSGEDVFLLRNDKGEWVLPKGVIRNGELANEVALRRVKEETGVEARIIGPAGETCYEFYSQTRRRPVTNRIDWFLMEAVSRDYAVSAKDGFVDGGFFHITDALDRITYSQDRSIVKLSYQKYRQVRKN